MTFDELDLDQRRESINTTQRFRSWRDAALRARDYRGSMTWSRTKGREYLLRSSYDKRGRRRQASLGPRSGETEAIKAGFETARAAANGRLEDLRGVMLRQAAVNRALGLGRMPVIGARILRQLRNRCAVLIDSRHWSRSSSSKATKRVPTVWPLWRHKCWNPSCP